MRKERGAAPATHQVIVNDDHQFVVWPARRSVPLGWRYVGKEGGRAELEFYLAQMAVDTVPTPLLITRPRPLDTHW